MNYTFTLQLFEGPYEHGFDTIEYRAKNIIRDIAKQNAKRGRLFYTESEINAILLEAYSIAGLQNVTEMIKQKLWYAPKENWIVSVV